MEATSTIGNIKPVSLGTNIGIKATDSPFATSFYFEDFYDDKQIKRFIKIVEKLVRTSKEYSTYIELLRTNIQALNHDNIMSNITTGDVDIEFHHYPFTLYEIIEILMTHHMVAEEKFTSFSIAKEVMSNHYKNIIGLVPLSKTNHELAHSGNIFISSKQIFGNYKDFIKLYYNGIGPDMMEKINTMERNTAANIPSDFKGLFK